MWRPSAVGPDQPLHEAYLDYMEEKRKFDKWSGPTWCCRYRRNGRQLIVQFKRERRGVWFCACIPCCFNPWKDKSSDDKSSDDDTIMLDEVCIICIIWVLLILDMIFESIVYPVVCFMMLPSFMLVMGLMMEGSIVLALDAFRDIYSGTHKTR